MGFWETILPFLGALAGATVSYIGLRHSDNASFSRLLEEKNQEWMRMHAEWKRELTTRFDEERLAAYSEFHGKADMAVFYAVFPGLPDRVDKLESALNSLRSAIGRIQILSRSQKTRGQAYALYNACCALHEPVSRAGSELDQRQASELTNEAFRDFSRSVRDELEIVDESKDA